MASTDSDFTEKRQPSEPAELLAARNY